MDPSAATAAAGASSARHRGAAVGFAAVDLLTAALILLGVFAGLPTRWWPVDGAAILVAASLVAAGVGLLARAGWATRAARIASATVLAVGLFLIGALVLAASFLAGVYDEVGRGGALIFVFVVALLVPYLVVLPAAQLVWLGPRRQRRP